ncbi:DNA-directed RNA polymerase sigma-70 factor [Hymenobacter qilianensis]|uniref:DNA-directed RNA polymerase sigma-70 factor n=2 Tax=Hymenobacter qilianensis TaxID=1385715 RepID=A0ACB5PQ37_9BACT|nr:RNA polymerase sigma-70 factor [Hymenobacter qilianensis]QNP53002.1 RNA polymerase sigma-70 factor [Hymenobacter qilianensis]GGF60785.1 DNA-directed RNA polymerase sigma-70 factor [Hymenobacter qilianensis]
MSIATEPASDLELRLAELQRTDAEAFMETLFRAFYRSLANVVFRIVQDRAVAEDLVQDVLLNVWKNRDTLHITSTYQAYLYRAAMNAALRHAARQKRQIAWDEASLPDPGRNTTDEQVHGQEAEAAVAAALDSLPPQCRAVFLLSRQEGMSYQQIADALEVAPKTVENQMGKALRLLRKGLQGLLHSFLCW